jgi:hypothetical protein
MVMTAGTEAASNNEKLLLSRSPDLARCPVAVDLEIDLKQNCDVTQNGQ